jgi:alpha-L-fucosidase
MEARFSALLPLLSCFNGLNAALLLGLFVPPRTADAQSVEMPGYQANLAKALAKVEKTVAAGPFQPSWDSLEKYKVPDWYLDGKFGIFIHWGVYSVPAFEDEWYPRLMYLQGGKVYKHQIETHGSEAKFGYKDFIPQFTASKFDANEWAELFRRSGAKFVVPVGEHHDGFPMYRSDLTEWNAFTMGPKRDVVGELEKAVRRRNMHFGVSSHRAEHWWFFNGGMKFDSDVRDPKYKDFYGPAHWDGVTKKDPNEERDDRPDKPDQPYLDDWLARTAEMVEKYNPDLVWFDWWIGRPAFKSYIQRFAAYYYNHNAHQKKGAVINYKYEAFPEKVAVLDIERGYESDIRPLFWQTDTSIGNQSWGYIENETFKTPEFILAMLIDIISKNGALLLNIGPDKNGVIPQQAQTILLSIGKWLASNGDAVYGTRPWKIWGEGPTKPVAGSFKDTETKPYTPADIRFTTKADALYAIALATPGDGVVHIKSLASGSPSASGDIGSVDRLGSKEKVKWEQSASDLTIRFPNAEASALPTAFRITWKK